MDCCLAVHKCVECCNAWKRAANAGLSGVFDGRASGSQHELSKQASKANRVAAYDMSDPCISIHMQAHQCCANSFHGHHGV
jgi:hypothetical protein